MFGIQAGLVLAPLLSFCQDVRPLLLGGMRLFFARQPVAYEEAVERAKAELVPALGQSAAQLLDGLVGPVLQ